MDSRSLRKLFENKGGFSFVWERAEGTGRSMGWDGCSNWDHACTQVAIVVCACSTFSINVYVVLLTF